jgi:hypothetical protein
MNRRGLLATTVVAVAVSAACAAGRSNYDASTDSGSDDGGSDDGGLPMIDAKADSFSGDASLADASLADAASGTTPGPSGSPADGSPLEDVLDAASIADATDSATRGDGPIAADSSPPTCSGVDILCNGSCVNPTNDPKHCGGCGIVCSSGLCGTSIAADMTSSPSGWTFNGSAAWDSSGPSARMTAAGAAGVTGTVIYTHPIVTDDFTASFQFRIGAGGGGRYDGMGFMIETKGPTAVGATNGSLGMGGLGGYGVELDVYDNGQCGDTSSDHVGIDSLSPCPSGSSLPTSLFASSDLTSTINLVDAQWHTTTVSLSAGAMSVTIDSHSVASSVALAGFMSGTPYYYGFCGATGGLPGNGGIQTEVKAVTMTFPTPRCL